MRAPSFTDESASAVLDDARQRAEAILEEARSRAETVLEEAAVRGGAAWDALRGERVGPPVAKARWPWALAAAVAGAAAGIAVAVALRGRADPPDAQDPEDLEAVIDRPTSTA
jgi:hypothetical protein